MKPFFVFLPCILLCITAFADSNDLEASNFNVDDVDLGLANVGIDYPEVSIVGGEEDDLTAAKSPRYPDEDDGIYSDDALLHYAYAPSNTEYDYDYEPYSDDYDDYTSHYGYDSDDGYMYGGATQYDNDYHDYYPESDYDLYGDYDTSYDDHHMDYQPYYETNEHGGQILDYYNMYDKYIKPDGYGGFEQYNPHEFDNYENYYSPYDQYDVARYGDHLHDHQHEHYKDFNAQPEKYNDYNGHGNWYEVDFVPDYHDNTLSYPSGHHGLPYSPGRKSHNELRGFKKPKERFDRYGKDQSSLTYVPNGMHNKQSKKHRVNEHGSRFPNIGSKVIREKPSKPHSYDITTDYKPLNNADYDDYDYYDGNSYDDGNWKYDDHEVSGYEGQDSYAKNDHSGQYRKKSFTGYGSQDWKSKMYDMSDHTKSFNDYDYKPKYVADVPYDDGTHKHGEFKVDFKDWAKVTMPEKHFTGKSSSYNFKDDNNYDQTVPDGYDYDKKLIRGYNKRSGNKFPKKYTDDSYDDGESTYDQRYDDDSKRSYNYRKALKKTPRKNYYGEEPSYQDNYDTKKSYGYSRRPKKSIKKDDYEDQDYSEDKYDKSVPKIQFDSLINDYGGDVGKELLRDQNYRLKSGFQGKGKFAGFNMHEKGTKYEQVTSFRHSGSIDKYGNHKTRYGDYDTYGTVKNYGHEHSQHKHAIEGTLKAKGDADEYEDGKKRYGAVKSVSFTSEREDERRLRRRFRRRPSRGPY